MFTPQTKGRAAGWPLTPARAGGTEGSTPAIRRGSVLGREKGKGVLGDEVTPIPPPPLGSLGDGRGGLGEGGEDVEAWERFRQEGLLDETGLLRKERDALRTTVSELQAEVGGNQSHFFFFCCCFCFLLINNASFCLEIHTNQKALFLFVTILTHFT